MYYVCGNVTQISRTVGRPRPIKLLSLVCEERVSDHVHGHNCGTRARRAAGAKQSFVVSYWQLDAGERRSTSHRTVVTRNGLLVSVEMVSVCRFYYKYLPHVIRMYTTIKLAINCWRVPSLAFLHFVNVSIQL